MIAPQALLDRADDLEKVPETWASRDPPGVVGGTGSRQRTSSQQRAPNRLCASSRGPYPKRSARSTSQQTPPDLPSGNEHRGRLSGQEPGTLARQLALRRVVKQIAIETRVPHVIEDVPELLAYLMEYSPYILRAERIVGQQCGEMLMEYCPKRSLKVGEAVSKSPRLFLTVGVKLRHRPAAREDIGESPHLHCTLKQTFTTPHTHCDLLRTSSIARSSLSNALISRSSELVWPPARRYVSRDLRCSSSLLSKERRDRCNEPLPCSLS